MDLATFPDLVTGPLVRVALLVFAVLVVAVLAGVVHLATARPRAHDDEYGTWGDTGSWRGGKPAPDEEEEGL